MMIEVVSICISSSSWKEWEAMMKITFDYSLQVSSGMLRADAQMMNAIGRELPGNDRQVYRWTFNFRRSGTWQ